MSHSDDVNLVSAGIFQLTIFPSLINKYFSDLLIQFSNSYLRKRHQVLASSNLLCNLL